MSNTVGFIIAVVCIVYQTCRIISLKGKLSESQRKYELMNCRAVYQRQDNNRLRNKLERLLREKAAVVKGMTAFFPPDNLDC